MKKLYFLLAGFFFWISLIGYANDAFSSPADTAELENKLENIQTLQADLKQTVLDENNTVVDVSTGHVIIKKPNRFRLEYTDPAPQIIVAVGDRVWIDNPDLKQMMIQHLDPKVSRTPLLLISSSNISIDQEFEVHKRLGGKFDVIPKDINQNFKLITLTFNGATISQIFLQTTLGQKTMIDFSHVQVNTQIDDKVFQVKIPKDTDIEDETVAH